MLGFSSPLKKKPEEPAPAETEVKTEVLEVTENNPKISGFVQNNVDEKDTWLRGENCLEESEVESESEDSTVTAYKCEVCPYDTNRRKGLLLHYTKKHFTSKINEFRSSFFQGTFYFYLYTFCFYFCSYSSLA